MTNPSGSSGDLTEPPSSANKKRKTTAAEERPARRALSCTECKRRKTKHLARFPVTHAYVEGSLRIVDGKEWRDGRVHTPPKDIEQISALREQINRLEKLIDTLGDNLPSQSQVPQAPTSAQQDRTTSGNSLESAAIDLEHLIAGPGIRPGITETLGSPIKEAQRPQTPAAFPLSSLFSSASFDPDLITVLPQLLPNSPLSQRLAEVFLDGPINSSWHAIARPAFKIQMRQYSTLTLDKLELEMDPLWFALYLMVLAMAVEFASADQKYIISNINADSNYLPTTLYHASIKALDKSDYLSKPQVAHIQVRLQSDILLRALLNRESILGIDSLHTVPLQQSSIALRHLDSAITTAQWLGLDSLEDSLSSSAVDDPALSVLQPRHQVEICKQLYHLLKFMDGTIFKRPGLWRLASNDGAFLPSNNDDQDYEHSDSPSEKPITVMTEASLSRIGSTLVDTIRSFTSDHIVSLHQVITYGTALEKLLNLIPSLPDAQTSWMMRTLHCSILYRLIRLHRPTLLRGYQSPEWSFSSNACVSSAKSLLRLQVAMAVYPHLRPSFIKRWIMGSIIVLAVPSIVQDLTFEEVIYQSQRICIGTFAELLPPIMALLSTADEFRRAATAGGDRYNLDVDLFFKEVRKRLSPTGNDDNQQNQRNGSSTMFDFNFNLDFDPNSMLPNFDFSFLQDNPTDSTGTWENMEWGLI
ncbi:hypothetical protein I204_02047 [Kwoniella mangroviensis CBS 8886]|nr:hypothetical protein I204_02047 [Kwoniella mangroviensis CBS 8886]